MKVHPEVARWLAIAVACSACSPMPIPIAPEEPQVATATALGSISESISLRDCPGEAEPDAVRLALYAGEPTGESLLLDEDEALAWWPVGTLLCVEGTDSGHYAVVRVVARPTGEHADLEVGPATARELGLLDGSIATARLSVVRPPPPP